MVATVHKQRSASDQENRPIRRHDFWRIHVWRSRVKVSTSQPQVRSSCLSAGAGRRPGRQTEKREKCPSQTRKMEMFGVEAPHGHQMPGDATSAEPSDAQSMPFRRPSNFDRRHVPAEHCRAPREVWSGSHGPISLRPIEPRRGVGTSRLDPETS